MRISCRAAGMTSLVQNHRAKIAANAHRNRHCIAEARAGCYTLPMPSEVSRGSQAQPIPSGASWAMMSGRTAKCGFVWHAHACAEVFLISSGYCHWRIGEAEGVISAPAGFVVGPGVPHVFWTDGFLPDGQVLGIHLWWFDPALLTALRGVAPELHDLEPLLGGMRRGLRCTPEAVTRALALGTPITGLAGVARTMELLACLAPGAEPVAEYDSVSDYDQQDLDRLSQVEGWMRARFREPLTLPQTAAACGLGVTTLNRLLKRHLRTTFLAYLSDLRLVEAVDRFRHSPATMLDIALDCGFGSVATFNRRFREAHGVSPQEWRREHTGR